MTFIKLFLICLAITAASQVQAADVRALSEGCEIALALSAAPSHLREDAGVYVLGDSGYEALRPPKNAFACIVERNHRDSVIPQCFDRSSQKANLQAILDTGRWLRSGNSFEEVARARQAALDAGDYAMAGPGIAYMISDFNYIYNDQRDAMLDVEPHLMFHAPNLSGEDFGADFEAAMANRGLPILNAPGPHGFMITFVEKPSDSADVLAACSGELPDKNDMLPFPPPRTAMGR